MSECKDTISDWLDWAERHRDEARLRFEVGSDSAGRTMASYQVLIDALDRARAATSPVVASAAVDDVLDVAAELSELAVHPRAGAAVCERALALSDQLRAAASAMGPGRICPAA